MTLMTTELSGLTKTAVLLVGMGREHAAKVLAEMRESEVEEITAEIMRLRDIDGETALAVFSEFHGIAQAKTYMGQGGMDFAKELLAASMGEEKAAERMHFVSTASAEIPFRFLHRADPRQLLASLYDAHPQTIALVLAHMSADQA